MNESLRIRLLCVFGALCGAGALIIAAPGAQSGRLQFRELIAGREVAGGEVLVRLRSQTRSARRQVEQETDADQNVAVGTAGWRRIHSASRGAASMIEALRRRGDVLAVEPNFILHSTAVPNDSAFPRLWGLQNLTRPGADIHATSAWDVSGGSRANVVGVVDTGIDYTHPDIAANVWSAPASFTVMFGSTPLECPAGSHGFNATTTPFSCDPMDDHSHGTHVSGTIGGVGNNGIGVAGVNWIASIMGLKFLDATGSGTTSGAIAALQFAMQAKSRFGSAANVRVLSNSYGGDGFSQAFYDEIQNAAAADMLFVAAAGNSSTNNDAAPFYPASFEVPSIISVAATDSNDALAAFSSYGRASVDLAAPGVGIYSTLPGGGYGYLSGTSMATPHVSGAAALVLAACNLPTTALRDALLNTVDVLPSLTGVVATDGRLNVDRAIRSCLPLNPPPTVWWISPAPDATFIAPASITLTAAAADSNGSIARVDFYRGSPAVFIGTGAPADGAYSFAWENVPTGTYSLTAVAIDNGGASTTSSAVSVTVKPDPAAPHASFIRTDTATKGTWVGVYGREGYGLANDAVSVPAFARVTVGGANAWTWASSSTDSRALQRPAATSRLAATWYQSAAYTIDVNLTDSVTHQFALYAVDWDSPSRIERVDILDPSGAVLDTRTLSAFNAGRYLIWEIGGHVIVRITSIAGANAVASGWFLDSVGPPNSPPSVSIVSPTNGATYTAPASVPLKATASDPDGTIARVDFYHGTPSVFIGTGVLVNGLYTFSWMNVPAGTYSATAVAIDNAGATTTSAPVGFTVNASTTAPSATFVRSDSTTQGTWVGVYGRDGYGLANDAVSTPAYVQVSVNGTNAWTWAPASSDPRALQRPTGTSRLAAAWYQGASYTIDVNLTDGVTRQFSVYAVDWDSTSRGERIDILDPDGALLDTRTLTGFNAGQYLVWDLKGHVTIRITRTAGVNAVVSGWFFDSLGPPNTPPAVAITTPTPNASFPAPATIGLAATASDSDGTIAKVEFFNADTVFIGEGTLNGDQYVFTWTNVAPGTYTLTAVATDNNSARTTSDSVTITVTGSIPGPTATFVRNDPTTQGTWVGAYGVDGYGLANDAVSVPAYARVVVSGAKAWTWALASSDQRALQRPSGASRLAAGWYQSTSYTIDVNLTDGGTHQFALYAVDWDSTSRVERIDILDPAGNVLDTRTVNGFNGGQYLIWDLSGHVTIRIIPIAGANAVISGWFLR